MTLTSVSLIVGLSFGAEYVAAMPDDGIENSLVVDIGIFRFIITL